MVPPLLKTRKAKSEIVARDNMRERRTDRNLEEAQATILDLQTQIYEINLKNQGNSKETELTQSTIKQLNQDIKAQAKKITRLEEEISASDDLCNQLKKSQVATTVDSRLEALKVELSEKVKCLKEADQSLITMKARVKVLEEASLVSNHSSDEAQQKIKILKQTLEVTRDSITRLQSQNAQLVLEVNSASQPIAKQPVFDEKAKDDDRDGLVTRLDSSKEQVKEFEKQNLKIRMLLTRVNCDTNTSVMTIVKAVEHVVDDLIDLRTSNHDECEQLESLQEENESLIGSNKTAKDLTKKTQDKLKVALEKARIQDIRISQLQREVDAAALAKKLPPSPAPSPPKQEMKVSTESVEEWNDLKQKLDAAKEAVKFEKSRAGYAEERLSDLESRNKRLKEDNFEKERKGIEQERNQIENQKNQIEKDKHELEISKKQFEMEKNDRSIALSASRSESGNNSSAQSGNEAKLKATITKLAGNMAELHKVIAELRDENTQLLLDSLGI